MEADFLRLILFLVGILVVLVVYFWERHKRINRQVDAIRNAEQSIGEIREDIESDQWVVMDEYQDDAESDASEMAHELDQLSKLVAEESEMKAAQTEQIPLFSDDAFEKPSATNNLESDAFEKPSATNNLESKVFIINLVSRGTGFNGTDLLDTATAVDLELGDMNIFHHYSGTSKHKKTALFSMASMVEPGTFPQDEMETFMTPGLVLFLQISGGENGLALYDDMLAIAEKLADYLDGELQDETHSSLTHQAVEFQREKIIEYQRRQLLLKNHK